MFSSFGETIAGSRVSDTDVAAGNLWDLLVGGLATA